MRHIFNYFNFNQLYKFASKEGFISRLKAMGARDEIISYVEGLEESLCGVVVGAVVKNKDISLDQLKELVANKERVQNLKKETTKEILEDVSVEEERIKNWIVPQIKKDKKNRALFLGNLDKINRFLSENDIDLGTYDLKSLLDYIDRLENFGTNQKSQDPVSQFLVKEMDRLNQKLLTINNLPLATWARKKAIAIYGEWEKQIRKAMVEKPFEQLMEESNKIREDIDHGLYRGRELPNTPLRNGEYESLVANVESLDDWHKNTASDIREYSINGAIAASNQWHREMADSGEGLQYQKIDRSDIVFGPDGWGSEENNGHFILELKSENDLKVEGDKMNHCVGRDSKYRKGIEKGTLRIFSLRHINNVYQPILTIETDLSGSIIRQDYGPSDKKIDQRYHDMVTEWASKNKLEDYSKLTPEDINKIKNPDILKEILTKTDDPYVLISIVKNPAANQDILAAIMAKTDDPYVLISIVKNPAANQDILAAIMAKTDDPVVLSAVAGNPATSPDTLERIIAKTDDLSVLGSIAGNPAANQAIFTAILAKTDNPYILSSIAQNPAANQDILAAIVAKFETIVDKRDGIYNMTRFNVLQLIAQNPAANQAIFTAIQAIFTAIMAKTNNPNILISIVKNPAANQDILAAIVNKTDDPYVLESVVRNSEDNLDTLERIIAKTDNLSVLQLIAHNPAANQAIFTAIMAKTDDLYVLSSIARNSAANPDTLERIIAKTDNPVVLSAVAENPAANQDILAAIVAKTDDPYTLNLVQARIEALKQKTTIASASYIDLIYKRACRFKRISLSN